MHCGDTLRIACDVLVLTLQTEAPVSTAASGSDPVPHPHQRQQPHPGGPAWWQTHHRRGQGQTRWKITMVTVASRVNHSNTCEKLAVAASALLESRCKFDPKQPWCMREKSPPHFESRASWPKVTTPCKCLKEKLDPRWPPQPWPSLGQGQIEHTVTVTCCHLICCGDMSIIFFFLFTNTTIVTGLDHSVHFCDCRSLRRAKSFQPASVQRGCEGEHGTAAFWENHPSFFFPYQHWTQRRWRALLHQAHSLLFKTTWTWNVKEYVFC